MEQILKIIAIGLVTCFAVLLIKPLRADFAIIISIVGGVIILMLVMNYLTSVFTAINSIIAKTGLNRNIFTLIIKIVGIGYLTEFSASLCFDAGVGGLSDKMLFGGKIILLVMSLPIVMDILKVITELLP